jgi:hypothetical protein
MDVCGIKVVEAPQDPSRTRISAQLVYDNNHCDDQLWFEFDQTYADQISDSGNPWLACLLPIAACIGEPLRICRPVDPLLLKNARQLLKIWACWYDFVQVIDVEAESKLDSGCTPQRTASFFSGGVDSFFTVLKAEQSEQGEPPCSIDDMITIWGFETDLNHTRTYEQLLSKLRQSAEGLGKNLIEVKTNLRTIRFKERPWAALTHGGGLSSVGLLFEKRFKQLLISSTHTYLELFPWGSHPLTDPLFSTTHTQVTHFDCAYDRVDKTKLVAQSDVAKQNLHVCAMTDRAENCCTCKKCYRTMITLDLMGVLGSSGVFERDSIPIEEIKYLHVSVTDQNDRSFINELIQLAHEKNRPEVAQALLHSMRYSESMHRRAVWADKIPAILLESGRRRSQLIRRVVWRVHHKLKSWMIRRVLCCPEEYKFYKYQI